VTANIDSCQGCSASRPSVDTIRPRFEAKLADRPSPPGRDICPHCHANFAALAQVPWTPKTSWWRSTTMRLQCPHCTTPLRDRHALQPPSWLVAAAIAWVIGIQLVTTGWTRVLLGLPVAIAL
jgi:hypothetical protein